MRRLPLLLLMLGLLSLVSTSCDLSEEGSGTVTLTGQILDAETNNPVSGAFIRIPVNEFFDETEDIIVEVDDEGRFTIDVDLDETTDILVIATADGFTSDQVSVLGMGGRTVEVPTFRIRSFREEDIESGTPSNILLLGQTHDVIGVIESGSVEVTNITFQVTDSAGAPVTLNNDALVRFRLGKQPGGNEFIAPLEAPTDNNGEVTVNLSSGTRAGVVQVIAEADVGGRTIRSKPVSVTIHGGLPDQPHFTLGPARFNFPGLTASGLTNAVSVIVGDKYANPVRPGTAVWFTSTHGIIEGSIGTNAEGRGSVNLISGNPLPPDGVAIIEAETADENQERVWSQIPVLFSGFPVVQIEPTTAILGQTYTLTVTDQNGNPLAEGTSISVRAEGTKVKATGNTDVTLDDTIFTGLTYDSIVRGPGITQFTFRAVEDLTIDETGVPTLETITIRVSGPNGGLEIVLTAGAPQVRTSGADVQMLPDGRVRIQAAN